MAKYLRKFETTSAYTAAETSLDKPNVSYIVETNGVEFKPYVPPQPIRYTASAKLDKTWDDETATFGTTIKSHTFENGIGTIEFNDDVTSIGSSAFEDCYRLTSVTIPDSVTSIGSSAFQSCEGLTSVTIPDGVTSINDYAFGDCTGLTSITIGNGVTSIGYCAFYQCTGLTSITIPNSVTSIGSSAFEECTGLTSVTIPNSVTSISGSAFSACSRLTNIVVDSANTVYDSRDNCNAIINTSTNELVAGCKNTVIPNTVTSIGGGAFQRCSSLTSIGGVGSGASVEIPNSVTSIGQNAFRGCSGLTSVTIPNSVTSIGNYAFQSCSGLTSITIGNGVTSIGGGAFQRCSSLTNITSNATTGPTIQSNTFESVKTGGTLTVPSGSSDYSVWMMYLGQYGWSKVEQ